MDEKKEFQHYPKSLHADGDRAKPERIVQDDKEEAAARAEGYRMIGEPAPEPVEKKAKGKKDPE